VDESLPYTKLPEITVATAATLVASPSHPTAYLTADSIPAGEKVQVIGADESAAWLLVLHDNLLGWMPTFYSRTNVATLTPALVVEPLSDKCTKYLDVTFAPDEAWISNSIGAVFVIGSIYRAQTETPFTEATLDIEIEGGGAAVESDYLHTPLTSSSAVVLFGFSVAGLQKGSRIHFNLSNPTDESLSFQAAFFSNECADIIDSLPIGKAKVVQSRHEPLSNADTAALVAQSSVPQFIPSPTPTTLINRKEGSESSKVALPKSPDPNWETIFYDNFDDGNADGWIRNKPKHWRVQNGEYIVSIPDKDTLATSLTSVNLSTDYAIEFRVKNVKCVDDGLDILGLYHVGLRHGSEYGAPNVDLWNRDGKKVEDKPYPLERDKWYKIRIEVTDHNILVHIDGNLLIAHFDDRAIESSDAIGLMGWSGACGPLEAHYDDVVVYVKRDNPSE